MTKKIINFVLSITLILLPIMKIPICFGISSSFYGAKIILLYGSASILLILLLINYKDLSFDKVDLLLLSFLILVCISTFFSLNLRVSILGSYDRFEGMLTFIAYYIIYYSAKYFLKFDKKFIAYIIAISIVISLLAISQYFDLFFTSEIFSKEAIGGATLGNQNFLGTYISLILPAIMCLYIFKGNKILLVPNALLFFTLLITLTRSAWIAFFVCSAIGIVYIIKSKKKEYMKRFGILFALFLVTFIVFNLLSPGTILGRYKTSKDELENKDKAGSGRIIIWKGAFTIIKNRPLLGSGPDAFVYGVNTYDRDYLVNVLIPSLNAIPDKVHNEFLQIACTIGIPALIIYLFTIALILTNLIKKDIHKNTLSFILLLCIISYLAQAFFNISVLDIAPLFWALLGISSRKENA